MSKLVVIADDFTGANDTGVKFAMRGADVAVSLTGETPKCDVSVINTETRAEEACKAGEIVEKSVKDLADKDTKIVFKKIDSTFRGNIGAEISAAAKAFDTNLIIVAAAIPGAGRTTIDGKCFVNGTLLAKTEFADDPKTPIHYSDISEIIAEQSDIQCISVPLAKVRSGEWGELEYNTVTALILDSETDDDLFLIGKKIADLNQRIVLVGAAGIASALPFECYLPEPAPVLVVAGSMSQTTFDQVNYGADHGLKIVDIDAQSVWLTPNETLDAAVDKAKKILLNKDNCAVRTMSKIGERERSQKFCEQQGIKSGDFSLAIADFLGRLSKKLISDISLSGVMYTGGDIAIAAARHIEAKAYLIDGEIEAGIPFGHFTNHNLKIVTKAGGFGKINSIVNVISFLQGDI